MRCNTSRTDTFVRSAHLTLRRVKPESCLAYHSLFGNFAWIDSQLFKYVRASSKRTVTYGGLIEDVGREAADVLLTSYFFVRTLAEERLLVDELLDRRRSLLKTGYYVGGLQMSCSNACNFSCSYCFADVADRRCPVRQEIALGEPNMSFELAERTIRKILALARSHGRDQIAVKFMGREPLLNWKVIRRVLRAFRDDGLVFAITTNGSLLTPAIADELREYDVRVVVSLDGPAEVNDRMRVTKTDAGSTYSVVERAMQNLARAGHPFGVSSVLSSFSDIAAMVAFVDRLSELGAREFELVPLMHAPGLNSPGIAIETEELAAVLTDLWRHAASRGILMHGEWVDPFRRILATHKFRFESDVARPVGFGCSATSHQLSLEPSGDVFPCRAMSAHYGHIDDLEGVLNSAAYQDVLMRTYLNVPSCRGCELEGFCQGTCLGSCEEASGNIYQPEGDYCALYRATTRRLLDGLEGSVATGVDESEGVLRCLA